MNDKDIRRSEQQAARKPHPADGLLRPNVLLYPFTEIGYRFTDIPEGRIGNMYQEVQK